MTDDALLLRRFADQGDQPAFAALVQRYLPLVHTAARRQVGGDAHLAADVAQAVFTDLARKAAALATHPFLLGWLYTSTHHAAAKTVRTERRRRAREQVASAMHDSPFAPDPADQLDWSRLDPVLDDALAQLKESDRTVLLLRYFDHRSYAEIGARIGRSENAARMQTDRALDKLRALLSRRGIVSTATALGAALTTQAVTAPPAGLAAAITHTAITQAAALGSAGIFVLMKTISLPLTLGGALVAVFSASYASQQQTQDQLRRELAIADAIAAPLPAPATPVAVSAAPQAPGSAAPSVAPIATAAATDVHDLRSLDRTPQPRKQARPAYPAELRDTGIRGEVVMQFVVDAEGKVTDIQTIRTSHPLFATAAAQALALWEFSPGQKNGRAVKTRLQLPLVFDLQRKEKNWF